MKLVHIGLGVLLAALFLASGCSGDKPKGTVSQQSNEEGKQKGAATAAAEAKTGDEAKKADEAKTEKGDEAKKADEAKTEKGDEAKTADGAAAAAKADRIKGPVAKVNGKDIASDEYYEELDKIQKHGAKIPEDRLTRIKENILKRLIEAELIKQAIDTEKIEVPAAEITKAFDEYKSRFKTDEQFQNYLKHGNLSVDDIQSRIKEKRALELLIEKKGSLTVDDKEAKDFYEKNKRFYQEKEAVNAKHILVKLDKNASPEDEKKALSKIKEAQAAIGKGEDFGAVAKKMSEGPSAPKGGDLGFFTRGQMVKPFEEKAFTMKPGDVSDAVRTRFGYHIIKVSEKREEKQKGFDEVKEQIYESLRNKKFFQERRTLLETLEKEAKIEKFIS